MTVLGTGSAAALRLVDVTLRVRWSDAGGLLARRSRGERFVFAARHDGLPLMPLPSGRVLIRFGGPVDVGCDDAVGLARLQAAMDANVAATACELGAPA